MSLSAAVIDAMVAAGCTPEQLAAAMKAALAEQDARKESKRANNAERQRRFRERHKAESNNSNALHGVTERDSVTPPSLSLPPNENNSNPPTHTHPDTKPRARKAHRLPNDWQPKPLTDEVRDGTAAWPDGAIARELARFRDWAASAPGSKGLKSDWDATWRNWLRRLIDEGKYVGTRPQNRFADKPSTSDTARDVAARLEARKQHGGGGHVVHLPRLGSPGRYGT